MTTETKTLNKPIAQDSISKKHRASHRLTKVS